MLQTIAKETNRPNNKLVEAVWNLEPRKAFRLYGYSHGLLFFPASQMRVATSESQSAIASQILDSKRSISKPMKKYFGYHDITVREIGTPLIYAS